MFEDSVVVETSQEPWAGTTATRGNLSKCGKQVLSVFLLFFFSKSTLSASILKTPGNKLTSCNKTSRSKLQESDIF